MQIINELCHTLSVISVPIAIVSVIEDATSLFFIFLVQTENISIALKDCGDSMGT